MIPADPDSVVNVSIAQPASVAPALPKRRARWRDWHRRAALLLAAGTPVTEVAKEVGRSRQMVYRLTHRDGFQGLVERHRTAMDARRTAALAAASVDAVEALHAVVRLARTDAAAVPAGEVVRAATAILGATASPSDNQRRVARRELLAALSEQTRRAVVAELDGGADSWARSLPDEEIDRLLGGES